jgi:preprotein translocase subunit YajC
MIATWTNLFFLIAQEGDGGGDQAAGGGASSYMLFVYIALFIGIFYFLLIRPGQKQRKQHDQLVNAIKQGDEIMTAGGLYATIIQVKEDYVMVELNKKNVVKLSRNSIARIISKSEKLEMENEPEEAAEIEEY